MKTITENWKSYNLSERLFWSCLFGYVLFLLAYLVANSESNLWDFRVYHTAAKTFVAGFDPYSLDQLKAVEPKMLDLPYMYPPLVLYLFIPLSYLELETAALLYTAVKLMALILLIKQWRLIYIPKKHLLLFALFCLLGFNAAIQKDFYTGNVSVFEQLLLWVGLVQWMKGRIWMFACCILLMASVKLLPIILLGLLLFSENKKWPIVLISSIFVFGAYLGLNHVLMPELTASYLDKFSGNAIPEGGIGNACTLEFWRSLLTYFDLQQGNTHFITYAVTVLAICLLAGKKLLALKRQNTRQAQIELIFIFLLSIALVMPRFKDYSYIMVILPVFYFITAHFSKLKWFVLGFVLCLGVKNVTIPLFREFFDLIWSYYTLLLVLLAWLLALFAKNGNDTEEIASNSNSFS